MVQKTPTLMDHLKELRLRLFKTLIALVITTTISFIFAKPAMQFLMRPAMQNSPKSQTIVVWPELGESKLRLPVFMRFSSVLEPRFQALKPTEALGNYMKVALTCGFILALPVIFYQAARFLAPGLTKKEKRYLFSLVPGTTLFFVAGTAFAYFIMLPATIPFLQGFLGDIVDQKWSISEYLSFVTSLLFWIGLAFELPLVLWFLAKLGIIDAQILSKNRKYAAVLIAIIAAVITPTVDPLNMALVMGPLIVLYEIGVILAKFARKPAAA